MYRIENKYHLSLQEMDILENRVGSLLNKDVYANEKGSYHVSSIYFDDLNDNCLKESVNGYAFRRKYRIRAYDRALDTAKLEIKEKMYHACHKMTSRISEQEITDLLNGNVFEASEEDTARTVFYMDYKSKLLHPAVIVSYDRDAYIYEPGNVRITFDRNITASRDFSRFGKKKMIKYLLEGVGVVEVKYDSFVPIFISKLLENQSMQLVSNSKYVLCRQTIDKKFD